MRRTPAAVAILVGGGIAGIFDITYAIVFSAFHGVAAPRVLKSVASGLLGAAAFDGGVGIAALGLALHFFIALTFAATFWFVSRRVTFLTRHPIVSGLAYGAIIYHVMTFVVLPLSNYPRKFTFVAWVFAVNVVAHMFLIGLPISLVTRRASST